jgi:hypothetical protein
VKQVVIEVRRGKVHVVSCPTKVQVIIRKPKRRSFKKLYRTFLYHLKAKLGRKAVAHEEA